jgi:hypothetical protein
LKFHFLDDLQRYTRRQRFPLPEVPAQIDPETVAKARNEPKAIERVLSTGRF